MIREENIFLVAFMRLTLQGLDKISFVEVLIFGEGVFYIIPTLLGQLQATKNDVFLIIQKLFSSFSFPRCMLLPAGLKKSWLKSHSMMLPY